MMDFARINELAQRHLDRFATDVELRELQDHLTLGNEAADAFVAVVWFDALLNGYFADQQKDNEIEALVTQLPGEDHAGVPVLGCLPQFHDAGAYALPPHGSTSTRTRDPPNFPDIRRDFACRFFGIFWAEP